MARRSGEATSRGTEDEEENKQEEDTAREDVIVLASGNLGLVYLMEEKRRLTLEEIQDHHPKLIPALRDHPHVGWLLVRSEEHGAVALGPNGTHYLDEERVEGEDPLAIFSPRAPSHLRRTDSFSNVADIMVNSFYDEMRDEGCAFEELISFHGGMGGPQTRPFILSPVSASLARRSDRRRRAGQPHPRRLALAASGLRASSPVG